MGNFDWVHSGESFSVNFGLFFRVSSQKAESNCLWIRFAFLTGSLVSNLSETPTMVCPNFFMYDHICLFDESFENMSFTYWL